MKKRKHHDARFKSRSAMEAIKGARTVSELVAGTGIPYPYLC